MHGILQGIQPMYIDCVLTKLKRWGIDGQNYCTCVPILVSSLFVPDNNIIVNVYKYYTIMSVFLPCTFSLVFIASLFIYFLMW